ncbi:hypothetical protein [Stagnihabitans tardus]|uniref:Phytanoyl-CoA dioxygenase n=1 Tax=Stagnihabitans tardus TaxID=2699202 RepID=A0AAE4Y9P6_9RHOB|nr:hypothetical protein [Stagnihabitans tardus]NBZ87431.1 hypothetical protein [Stagnihabitans tardus]
MTPIPDTGYRLCQSSAIADWARAAHGPAIRALQDEPRRHGGTWAVGLDLLPNAPDGSIGAALPWQDLGLDPQPLHPAQLSAVFQGYPRRDPDETEAAHRFRITRDATHLDGLLPLGPDKRRFMKEPHAWILGLALTESDAAPLVVWEGSHHLIRAALARALAPHDPATWGDVDLTEAYAEARRVVFASCKRVALPQKPGQAVILHRMALHGVAPWAEGASAPPEGRIVAYFRPLLPSVEAWLRLP